VACFRGPPTASPLPQSPVMARRPAGIGVWGRVDSWRAMGLCDKRSDMSRLICYIHGIRMQWRHQKPYCRLCEKRERR
jgi:hypothetical protein